MSVRVNVNFDPGSHAFLFCLYCLHKTHSFVNTRRAQLLCFSYTAKHCLQFPNSLERMLKRRELILEHRDKSNRTIKCNPWFVIGKHNYPSACDSNFGRKRALQNWAASSVTSIIRHYSIIIKRKTNQAF